MILFSLGLPSPFADWCDAVVAELAKALGPVEAVVANRVDEFTRAAIGSPASCLVVVARQLGRLQRSLAEADRPLVVAIDDPRRAMHHLVADRGVEFFEAVRLISWSCASMIGCLGLPRARILRGEAAAADPAGAVAAIAQQFDIAIDEDYARDLVEQLTAAGKVLQNEGYQTWWEGLGQTQRAAVAGAVDPYADRFAGGELGPITWERELFLIDGKSEQRAAASGPVDITGRPRFLIWGPYIALPPGPWSATVALGFSEEASENSYIVEFVADRPLASVRIEPRNERSVEIDLHFAIEEPLDDPVVLRVSNERAAFDGRLALGYVVLSQHAHLRPEVQDYFNTVLAP